MLRKVFGALGQLSFSLGMFQLVFGSTTVIYVSLSGVFTPKKEATYFQFSSGPFRLVFAVPDRILDNSGLFWVFSKCF